MLSMANTADSTQKNKSFPVNSSASLSSFNFFTRWNDTADFASQANKFCSCSPSQSQSFRALSFTACAILQRARLRMWQESFISVMHWWWGFAYFSVFFFFFPGVGEMNLVIQSDPRSLHSVPPTSLLGSKTIWTKSSYCRLSMVSESQILLESSIISPVTQLW